MSAKNIHSISRKDFLKGAAAGIAGSAMYGLLGSGAMAAAEGVAPSYIPGTYTSVQATPYAKIEVSCTYTEQALTDVSYRVLSTAKGDYFTPFATVMQNYCAQIVEAGSPNGVDGVSGASFCTNAIRQGVNACTAQALGITLETEVNDNPQVDGYDTFEGDCSNVFSPVALGTMTLPNRIIKSAGSGPWSDVNGSVMPVAAEVYGEMAANGVSLIILQGGTIRNSGILPDGLNVKEGTTLEEELDKVRALVDVLHENGAKVGYQMCFGGLAPSVADSVINETPVEDLDAFIDRVGISAERAAQVGIDCVEIKGASADALNGFLTRRVNAREDEYGPQSIENRTRLFRRMIAKIKEVNGSDYPVGALINAVEENDITLGSNDLFITVEEAAAIAQALEAEGADWLQVRVGANGQEMNIWAPDVQHIVEGENGLTGYGTKFDFTSHFGGVVDGSHSGFAAFLPAVKAIKAAVSIPVGAAAYMDLRVGPDYIDRAIADGELDLVFMNRPLNCDPTLPAKIQAGSREDVRPCMKCMHCHDRIGSGGRAVSSCRMNATSFHSLTADMPEGAVPVPAETAKNVMVIGAGPAGLEAARVLAERGHQVSLYDSADKLGGRLHFARGVKGDHEHFEDMFRYYEAQLDKLGVNVQLRSKVDAETVKTAAPDAVVVATGAVQEQNLTASASIPVFTPEQAFGSASLGEHVAIVGANVQAIDFAAYLVHHGKKVTVVNPLTYADADNGQSGWFRTYILAYLQANGTMFRNNASVDSMTEEGLRIVTDCGLDALVKCDSVIEFTFAANTALADEIRDAGFEVLTVGDCAKPWNIQQAIYTGNIAARSI